MGDIKTRFSLEGEQQFKSAMTNAANAIKVLNSEQKLAKAQFQNNGTQRNRPPFCSRKLNSSGAR